MNLKDYLVKYGIKQKAFADLLGVSASHLYHILVEKYPPGIEVAFKIEEVSNGLVDIYSWKKTSDKKKSSSKDRRKDH